jgi:uncharacterized protein YeeX (DUF496 family)
MISNKKIDDVKQRMLILDFLINSIDMAEVKTTAKAISDFRKDFE